MKPLVQFQRVKSFKKVERERFKQIHKGGRSRSRGQGDLDFRFFARSRWFSQDLVSGRGDGGVRRGAAAVPIQLRARQVKRLVRPLFQVQVETSIATFTLHIK